jgi:hypothetical protein|tara:strand:- start:26 stop:322 length:297 start_codon:yes stop_codon:yes gene_type:complete
MKDTIQEHQFIDALARDENSSFSYEGAKALFEHLTHLEDDIGKELEFDPIAFRCKYSEYNCFKDIQEDYNDLKTIEDLRNHTTVIEIPNTERLIIQAY